MLWYLYIASGEKGTPKDDSVLFLHVPVDQSESTL